MTADAAGLADTFDSPTADLGTFEFACGESIPLEVAYETYGEYRGDNAVLVCHALTGSQHVTDTTPPAPADSADVRDQARGWWSDVVGPGKAIDTDRYFVVCANVPGGCYGTTGPASIDPETGEPYGTDFPPVTVGDWTRAQRRLLNHLGVDRLHAVVGGSVGGMNAIDWAKRYPDRVERVAAVAAAARLDPQCLALDAIARRAIITDPDWRGGDYYGRAHPDHGLAQARRVGHVMYLSKDSMRERFGRQVADSDALPAARSPVNGDGPDPTAGLLPYREVESYLDYQADRFVDRFDANSYLYLLAAMDDYDLAAGHASDADALSGFDGEALALSFTGDWHFTVEQAGRLTDAVRAAGASAAHHVIDSDYGHDAFLAQPDLVGPPLRDFLADGVRGRAVADAHGSEPECRHAPVHSSLLSD